MLHPHTRKSPGDTCHTHRYNIPDHKLPIYSTRAHSADSALGAPFKWPHTRDRVLVHSEKLSARRYVPTSSVSTRIRISERVECATVEPANASSFRSRPTSTSARVIQRSNECPACFRTREHHGLAIVTSCNDAVFASPRKRDIWQCTDPDVLDDRAPGIDNADRAVMAYRHHYENPRQVRDNAHSQTPEHPPKAKS